MQKGIRSVQLADAGTIRDIYGPFVSKGAISFEIEPPDAAEMKRRIAAITERYPWLVFEVGGKVLGYAYAAAHHERHAYRWSVDVSVYLDSEARRRGVGRALYSALFEILRRQGYVNAYASITLPNPASVALHESLGFTPVGVHSGVGFKLGRWHDVAWYQLRLSDAPTPAEEIRPASDLFQEEGTATMLREYASAVKIWEGRDDRADC